VATLATAVGVLGGIIGMGGDRVAARRPLATSMRTILHRFATDRPIPDLGVDVAGAFKTW
jgi:hypothetical protein